MVFAPICDACNMICSSFVSHLKSIDSKLLTILSKNSQISHISWLNDYILIKNRHHLLKFSNCFVQSFVWNKKFLRPVNLHPLFLFWKHGSVCDPKKNQVKNMGCKKQGAKNWVFVIQKKKRAAASSLFE